MPDSTQHHQPAKYSIDDIHGLLLVCTTSRPFAVSTARGYVSRIPLRPLSLTCRFLEPGQYRCPASRRIHADAQILPTLAMTLQVATLKLDPRRCRAFREELERHLAGARDVWVVVKIGLQMPGENHLFGWLPQQHSTPLAFGARDIPFEPPASRVRL